MGFKFASLSPQVVVAMDPLEALAGCRMDGSNPPKLPLGADATTDRYGRYAVTRRESEKWE